MQEDSINSLNLLPKRQKNAESKFQYASKITFLTNYYDIKIDTNKLKLYQYTLKSDVPEDSTEILFKIVKNITLQLKEKIGLIFYRGNMLWGNKELKLPTFLIAKYKVGKNEEMKQIKCEVLIQKTKQIFLNQLQGAFKEANKKQIFNIQIKNKLRLLKMCQLGNGKFYDANSFLSNRVGQNQYSKTLSVWNGVKFSLCSIKNQQLVQIDSCSRVLRTSSFLETLRKEKINESNQNSYFGASVVARYGNHNTYKIEEIMFKMSPKSTFYHDKSCQFLSFEDYYKKFYNMVITDLKQPLLRIILKTIKQIKDGKVQSVPVYGFLIPQFVSLSGMSEMQKSDRKLMQKVSEYTKMDPIQRVNQAKKVKDKMNSVLDLFEIGQNKQMGGFLLKQPEILLRGNNSKQSKEGMMHLRQPIKSAVKISDYLFVYSVGEDQKIDDNEADYCVETIITASKTFGIKIQWPCFVTVKGNKIQNWKKAIQEQILKNGTPQIVVLFIQSSEQKLYGPLKRYLVNQIKIASQVIKRQTVSKSSKSALSAASKIILQMNSKLGYPLWEVKTKNFQFLQKNVMYGSLVLSKGSDDYTLAFVGTTNSHSTGIYSQSKFGIKKKQEIPQALLQNIFYKWGKSYFKVSKELPNLIIIYREGLSKQQILNQVPRQIQALKKAIKTIKQKSKASNYNPEIVYITVDKKINTKFFSSIQSLNTKQKTKLINPTSGSIILQELSSNQAMDFHLVPQNVTQGTCTPCHYRIVFKESDISIEALAEFTFEQCFNYFNWQGAVRVPGCMQAADKLSKLVGQHIKEDVESPEMSNKYYFL